MFLAQKNYLEFYNTDISLEKDRKNMSKFFLIDCRSKFQKRGLTGIPLSFESMRFKGQVGDVPQLALRRGHRVPAVATSRNVAR